MSGAKVVTRWGAPGVCVGQACVRDHSDPIYLDGAQCQYVVELKLRGGRTETVAYVYGLEHALLLADALNACLPQPKQKGTKS